MSELGDQIAALAAMPLAELRREWQHYHPGLIMPERLPRDLLVRSIAWKLQEQTFGGTPPAVSRQLAKMAGQLARSGSLDLEREVSLKPGAKLVREWRGCTYRVLVLSDGYQFEKRRYASLSHVARVITGTQWSGPRFFGLKQRSGPERRDGAAPAPTRV